MSPWCPAGKWTVQQAAELSVAAPTIEAALDARFLSGAKEERVAASAFFEKAGLKPPTTAEVTSPHSSICRAPPSVAAQTSPQPGGAQCLLRFSCVSA